MRYLFSSAAFALATLLSACGGSPPSNSVNGSWSAALSTSTVQQPGTFTFNLTQSNTTIAANSLNFTGMGNLSPCFGVGTTLTGSLSSAMMNADMDCRIVGARASGQAPRSRERARRHIIGGEHDVWVAATLHPDS